MTTPEEPREATSSPSDTGWPVHDAQAPALFETSDPTDAEEEGWPALPEPASEPETPAASEALSADVAPVVGRTDEPEPEPEPEPEVPASEAVSADVAPVVGRTDEPEPEPQPEPQPEVPASEAVSADVAPVVGRIDEPEPEPQPEPVAAVETPRRRAMSASVIALVLMTVLMALANGFVWYRVHQHSATDNARRAGLEASRDAARVLFSYDYRELDKDFSAGKAVTTGAFRKQYGETTAKVVTPVAKDKKAVVKAEVVTAGVVSASPQTVVTIVYVNQVTTSSLAAAPKVDLSRVRMTMTKVGGHWLVSKVDAL